MREKRRRAHSIRDIADAARVSVSTVSRVLNASGYVAPDTRARVQEAIARFGYTPSPIARGLRSSELPVIGALVPDITDDFYNALLVQLQQALYRKKYLMMAVESGSPGIFPIHERIGASLPLCGWIVCDSGEGSAARDVPTVYISPHFDAPIGPAECVVESDNEMGGWLATRELILSGCARVACLTDSRHPLDRNARYAGYQRALQEAGMPADSRLVAQTEWIDGENGYLHTRALFEAVRDVDGLFCTSDGYLSGAMTALAEMGKNVPNDVCVVGYDDQPISRWEGGGCTTIRQNVEEIARCAVSSLLELMQGHVPEITRKRIPVELVKRSTTRAGHA